MVVAERCEKPDWREQDRQRRTLGLVLGKAKEIDENRDEDFASSHAEEPADHPR
jgi:hypothetical protein